MKLGIVIPCYNEQEILPETVRQTTAVIERLVESGKISDDSKVLFVDDGSQDNTWALIEQFAANGRHVMGIKLSKNCGHQNALVAGLFTIDGDAVISIDADLQDDINVIDKMVDKYLDGAQIVYGVRQCRTTDTALKRVTAESFYRLMTALGADSVPNHADFRLMSRRALECLKQFSETNLYLRGLVPLIGFKSECVYYDRGSRLAGQSKYPLKRMISLALDAITSFSVVPLRLITLAGFAFVIGSMVVSAWALWVRFVAKDAIPGWTSVVLPMYLLGGIQMFCTGIIGEYLGRVYQETKARPRYFIERVACGKAIDPDCQPESTQDTNMICSSSVQR